MARPNFGIGLRRPHITEVLARRPTDVWFEVHAENFMYDEWALASLRRIREFADLSLHGVALSLGGVDRLDTDHLQRLKHLVHEFNPFVVSEHLAWSSVDGVHLNDLLPLPYTEESLELMISHVDHVQAVLNRRILIENPSRYLSFHCSTIDEASFLCELALRTGCGLLCDVNNIVVSSRNIEIDAEDYLARLSASAVDEFHLAGHSAVDTATGPVFIDDHGSEVNDPVWSLYGKAVERFGPLPTLIEWDNDLPSLSVLLNEASKGRRVLAGAINFQTDFSPAT